MRRRSVRVLMGWVLLCAVGCVGTPEIDAGPVDAGPADAGASDAGADGEVFALADPGDTAAQLRGYLVRPEIAGVAWRATWKAVEPADGTWDWSRLDGALDEAADAGKRLTIHIGASGGGWPGWLVDAGVATYSGTTPIGTVRDPLPWDPLFVSRYGRLMEQLATHLAARPTPAPLRAVSVGAPVAELSLAGCSAGTLGTGAGAVTYDRARYLAAWNTCASAVLAGFPSSTVVISAPVAVICRPDADGEAFYSELMGALPRASVFAADLNALGSQRAAQRSPSLRARPLLFQTIWSAANDPTNRFQGTLSQGVCAGRALGARYFELYKADLDSGDSNTKKAIDQARGLAACP